MWIFFYPLTTQQDKALERQPLDRVTQSLQMETSMPENWNCLVQRDEEKTLCWTKQRKQHSKVRTQWHTAHKWGPLHLAPRGKTIPSVAKATWVVTRLATFPPTKLFYSFRLLSVFDLSVFDLYIFSQFKMNKKGRAKTSTGKTVYPEKGNNLWLSELILNSTRK